jgi:hypothetical protein
MLLLLQPLLRRKMLRRQRLQKMLKILLLSTKRC